MGVSPGGLRQGLSFILLRDPILNDESHDGNSRLCAISTSRSLGVSKDEQESIGSDIFMVGDHGGYLVRWCKLLELLYGAQLGSTFALAMGSSLQQIKMEHIIVGVANIHCGFQGTGHAVALRREEDGELYMYDFGCRAQVTQQVYGGIFQALQAAICEKRNIPEGAAPETVTIPPTPERLAR